MQRQLLHGMSSLLALRLWLSELWRTEDNAFTTNAYDAAAYKVCYKTSLAIVQIEKLGW